MKEYSVLLRAFETSDYEFLYTLRNNPKIHAKTCGRFKLVSSEMEKAWVNSKIMNNQQEEYFAICLNDETKRIIGYLALREIDYKNQSARGAGIVIAPEYQTADHVIDAHLLLFDYAFNNLCLNRLSGACMEEHKDSIIMNEMLGFKLEGIVRQGLYKNRKFHNVLQYGLLAKEYYSMLENGEYEPLAIAKKSLRIRKSLRKQ